MFDAQRVPQWMASQLPVALATRMIAKQQQQSLASKSSTTGVVSGKQAKVNKSLQLIGWPTQSGRRVAATPKPAQQQSSPSTQQPSSQQQLKQQPTKKHQQQNGNVIALGSVAAKNASPDDAFFSGAWLFDAQSVPQWLASQLPVATAIKQSQNKKQNNSNGLRRPQSPGSRRT
ncbi:hypothetical protein BC828DRAFT_393646 [Blastocladiella britannica]|nr:hypothetical protein BC828DRAFT_393646 [Blastocladiella britannica]